MKEVVVGVYLAVYLAVTGAHALVLPGLISNLDTGRTAALAPMKGRMCTTGAQMVRANSAIASCRRERKANGVAHTCTMVATAPLTRGLQSYGTLMAGTLKVILSEEEKLHARRLHFYGTLMAGTLILPTKPTKKQADSEEENQQEGIRVYPVGDDKGSRVNVLGQNRPSNYRCAICGQIKTGHTCQGPPKNVQIATRGRARVFNGPSRHSHLLDQATHASEHIVKSSRQLRAALQVDCEEAVQEPHADVRDALRRRDIAVFNAWAMDGRDVVMEATNVDAFEDVWGQLSSRLDDTQLFTAIDAGCGNGWAARRIAKDPRCKHVQGVDAAACMVDRAQALAGEEQHKVDFEIADIAQWVPEKQVDVVNLVNVLYFIQQPQDILSHIAATWLKPGASLLATVDCYKENEFSHSWSRLMGVDMLCLTQSEWRYIFKAAGLVNVKVWRCKPPLAYHSAHSLQRTVPPTLCISAQKAEGARLLRRRQAEGEALDEWGAYRGYRGEGGREHPPQQPKVGAGGLTIQSSKMGPQKSMAGQQVKQKRGR